jgi:hypothetical protein
MDLRMMVLPEVKCFRIKVNWIDRIPRRNCLLHDAIEEQMTEVKGVERRTQLFGDLRNRKKYWG